MGGRERHKLTAVAIRKAPPGRLMDGGGLMLERSAAGGSWVYRHTFGGKRREMGLGSWPDLSLAQAREERDRWAAVLLKGGDPLAVREAGRDAARVAAARRDPTLAEAVDAVFAAIRATLRDGGERGRWRSPLDVHVLPVLGKRLLSSLTATDLRDCLAPIWRAQHPTAEKAIQRLGKVFREGRLMDLPCDPFTVEKARSMLGAVTHVARHIPATPWREVPALYARLTNLGPSHLCLRLMILTAMRATPARGLRFDEVEGDVWTVPAARMKGTEGRVTDFRVPLAAVALDVLATAQEAATGPLAFAGTTGNPVSVDALEKALDVLGEAGRPHGFRSSFKDWTRETGMVAWEVAETALAHKVGGAVERSYQRSDLLEQRREAMAAWARHVVSQA